MENIIQKVSLLFEDYDGSKEWRVNGLLHRVDGPAVEWANGSKEWYKNDELHRENGPAVEWANGSKEWWINGEQIQVKSQEEFKQYLLIKKLAGLK